MAEILVRAISSFHSDAVKNLRGCDKRGDIVSICPDGWLWGNRECPPNFVVIKVPGYDPSLISAWVNSWALKTAQQLTGGSAVTDIWNFTVNATEYNPTSGEGKIAPEIINQFLIDWAATNIVSSDNTVSFTVNILSMIETQKYWGVDITGLLWAQVSYTQATGTHRIKIDYTTNSWTDVNQALLQIRAKGIFVSENVGQKTITMDVKRTDVQSAFNADRVSKIDRTIRRRRYALIEATIKLAVNAGGIFTVTSGQALAALIDKTVVV